MSDASPGTGELNVTSLEDLEVAHRVLVLEFAAYDVTEDFHLAVAMSAEALVGFNAVFIDNAKVTKVLIFGVVVVGE